MNNKASIIHLLIIWSKAQSFKDHIVDDLQKEFEILKVFRCKWEKEKFLDNYFVFYSHSQCHRERNDYRRILDNKVKVCGDGEFTAIILRDNNPLFEDRQTSSGVRKVNTRMFDKKCKYREMTGGGHRIHSSDDAWETNKDLTILFGMNTEDFCQKFNLADLSIERTGLPEVEEWKHNCVGVGGYQSISDFFYVLNNTIEYVVLRNHEVLPEEYTVEGHGDIDLLVANRNYVAYLTLAQPVFKEPYRVYHMINIAGKEVPFDFRYVQDNYYSPKWEQDILKTRVMSKDLFYVPSPEHQFYTLLYHAYIQKWEVKSDYIPKLTHYGKQINIDFKDSPDLAVGLLDAFMLPRNYEYIRPNDRSVLYNKKNLQYSKVAFRHGECIKQMNEFDEHLGSYYCAVFKKESTYIKIGTDWLIQNERRHLDALKDCGFTPKVLCYEQVDSRLTLLEETAMTGIPASDFFSIPENVSSTFIRSFIKKFINLLITLSKKEMLHRDLLSDNVLVSKKMGACEIALIDFGWACKITEMDKPCPVGLGGIGVALENKFDSYECARLLQRLFYKSSYVDSLCKVLFALTREDYKDSSNVICKLEEVAKKAEGSMPITDRVYLTYRKYRLYLSACNKQLNILSRKIKRRL